MTEDWLWPRSTTLLPHLLRWCSGSILSFYSVKTAATCPSLTCLAFNNFPRSAMPDVTNNLVRKPHSSDTGSCCILEADDKFVKTSEIGHRPHHLTTGAASMQRLPDLGLGPASHLKTGSVMDILGSKTTPFSCWHSCLIISGKKSWVADLWCLSINYEMVLSRKRWFPLHLNQWLVNAVEESSQLQNLSYIRDQGRFSVTNQELKTFLHGATEKGILRPNSSQN